MVNKGITFRYYKNFVIKRGGLERERDEPFQFFFVIFLSENIIYSFNFSRNIPFDTTFVIAKWSTLTIIWHMEIRNVSDLGCVWPVWIQPLRFKKKIVYFANKPSSSLS